MRAEGEDGRGVGGWVRGWKGTVAGWRMAGRQGEKVGGVREVGGVEEVALKGGKVGAVGEPRGRVLTERTVQRARGR